LLSLQSKVQKSWFLFKGVSGNIPVVNPAARDPSYVASQATFPDSLPVASDLLVERLEEISTQQELVEDPER